MFRITVIVLAALLFGGCLAPEALEEQFFVLEKAEYKDPGGILTFNGTYQKKQWGIKELRGRISGEALELYGTAEFWGGEKKISHQITVPERINQVRIGSRILWERQPVKKEIVPAAETVPEEKKVASDPAIRQLMIGGNNIGHLKVDFADFREIFWKEESSEINSLPEIKVIETADGNFKFDCLAINKDYPSLEILAIRGGKSLRQIDLTGLALPELKKLILDNVEVTGLEKVVLPALQEFYLNDFRHVPLGRISLPADLPELHTAGIQSFAGNFDFASLIGKPLKKLWLNGDCSDFAFLQNMPLEELKLTGFRGLPGKLDLLQKLPLKKLCLKPLQMNDWSFLAGLKLQLLEIRCAGENNFSPELLKDMPLEVLRLTPSYRDYGDKWTSCRELPLKELILQGGTVPEKFLWNSRIERLGLYHCRWHLTNPVPLFNHLPQLKHLAVWRIFQVKNPRRTALLDRRVQWKNFAGRELESLCISAEKLDFISGLPRLKRLMIKDGKNITVLPEVLQKRDFEILHSPDGTLLRQKTQTASVGGKP